MDPQAQTLNDIIQSQNSNILEMLSKRGKNIFFPKLGILSQSAQAKGAIRGNISNISHLTQSLLQSVYSHESYQAAKQKKFSILKTRYSILKETIFQPQYAEYFESLPFNSGYFMCVKLCKGLNAEQVRLHLLEKYSTGVIAFGNIIRLAFSAIPQAKIVELIDNLYHACIDLDKK